MGSRLVSTRPMTRRDLLRLLGYSAGGVALADLLIACGGNATPGTAASPTATVQAAVAGDTLTVAISGDPGSLDPEVANGMPQYSLLWHMYESPVWRDAQMNLVPWLAEKYDLPKPDQIRLTVRQGVEFHNGTPLTPDSLKFSIMRNASPDSKSYWHSELAMIQDVLTPDSKTAIVQLPGPFRSALMNLTLAAVMDRTFVSDAKNKFAVNPMGTGPYRFVEYAPGQHLIMERFEKYWGTAPKMKRIQAQFIVEDSTRLAALESGQVYIINNVPPDKVAEVNARQDVHAVSIPTTRLIFTTLRMDRKPFSDLRVRQAVNYAVDKNALVKDLLAGQATVAQSPLSPKVVGGNVKFPIFEYDPEKAKALINAAGVSGQEIVLGTPVGRYLMDKQVAQAIQGYLQAVGLKVTIDAPEWSVYLAEVLKYKNSKYDMALLGWAVITMEPDYELRTLFYGKPPAGNPWEGYANTQVNAALDAAVKIYDLSQAEDAYHPILKQIWNDCPFLWLYFQPHIDGVNNKVHGYQPSVDAFMRFENTTIA